MGWCCHCSCAQVILDLGGWECHNWNFMGCNDVCGYSHQSNQNRIVGEKGNFRCLEIAKRVRWPVWFRLRARLPSTESYEMLWINEGIPRENSFKTFRWISLGKCWERKIAVKSLSTSRWTSLRCAQTTITEWSHAAIHSLSHDLTVATTHSCGSYTRIYPNHSLGKP